MGWMYLLELYHGVTSSFFGIGILYFAGNRYLIIYSVNLLLLTNECQQRSSTDYALGVAHNTSRIFARVNATLSPQLVGSASSDNSTPKCLSS